MDADATPTMSPRRLVLGLGALTSFGPLALDLYLPALPELADDLDASEAAGQATLSACMVGLALGQLVAGPLSDRVGRRRPLLAGVALFAATSLLCALAPGIWTLVLVRLAQGLAGGAGIVIARAIVRDLHAGDEAARMFSLLMIVSGAAPVLAPVLGSQLLHVTGWRGIFAVLGAFGVALVGAAVAIPETLPAARRHAGGLASTLGGLRRVARDPVGVALAAVLAFGLAGMFTYISLGAFVLQEGYGLSPQAYGIVFAVNGIGILALGPVNAALVVRLGARALLGIGVAAGLVGAALLLAAILAAAPLLVVLAPLFLVVASVGLVAPNATALLLDRHGRDAGAASALLGLGQFSIGAALPLVGSLLGGPADAMAWTILVALVAATLAFLAAGRRSRMLPT